MSTVTGHRSAGFYRVQERQLAALARRIRLIQGPVVVCGDFNVAGDSTLLPRFLSAAALRDAFAAADRRRSTPNTSSQAGRMGTT